MTTTARRPGPPPPARIRVGKQTRKALLALHVITAVGLLGADLAVLALVVRAALGPAAPWIYPAAAFLGSWVLQPLAITSLLTGIVQGLVTRWGVLVYWWTAIKLALNTAGVVLALTVLVPTLHRAADAGAHSDGGGLVRDCGAASSVLIATVLISMYKPLGRINASRMISPR